MKRNSWVTSYIEKREISWTLVIILSQEIFSQPTAIVDKILAICNFSHIFQKTRRINLFASMWEELILLLFYDELKPKIPCTPKILFKINLTQFMFLSRLFATARDFSEYLTVTPESYVCIQDFLRTLGLTRSKPAA